MKSRESVTKREARFRLQFRSEDFLRFIRGLPCVRCGSRYQIDPHHEPQRGSGGTWKDISPLCRECHTTGPGARHGPNSGVVTFWSFGITYQQSNAETQAKWLDVAAHVP